MSVAGKRCNSFLSGIEMKGDKIIYNFHGFDGGGASDRGDKCCSKTV